MLNKSPDLLTKMNKLMYEAQTVVLKLPIKVKCVILICHHDFLRDSSAYLCSDFLILLC